MREIGDHVVNDQVAKRDLGCNLIPISVLTFDMVKAVVAMSLRGRRGQSKY